MSTSKIVAMLEKRLARRKREVDYAWKHWKQFEGYYDAEVRLRFRQKVDIAVARYDECRLILNAVRRLTRDARKG